jgi:hypothetical protein
MKISAFYCFPADTDCGCGEEGAGQPKPAENEACQGH